MYLTLYTLIDDNMISVGMNLDLNIFFEVYLFKLKLHNSKF